MLVREKSLLSIQPISTFHAQKEWQYSGIICTRTYIHIYIQQVEAREYERDVARKAGGGERRLEVKGNDVRWNETCVTFPLTSVFIRSLSFSPSRSPTVVPSRFLH